MNDTFQQGPFLSEIREGTAIPAGKLAYFRARLRNALYDVVVSEFIKQREGVGLKKNDLARRIHRRPEQMTRWLSTPQNWTLDTVSDLLVAMGIELKFTSSNLVVASDREQEQSAPAANNILPFQRINIRRSHKPDSYGFGPANQSESSAALYQVGR